ncbi:hypothetical protein RT41_GL000515 [Lactococcus fujiensis JCM 16395]|uniref:Uncharacterized protein n=1 Tax=Lactococcus fujiensis JCM 16395 TaxID=1291764 RepID=A0A2A5RIU3_9LACT|nr:hypothetical protein RT41_GL000515 [Lactococcus fujiensis JCM 16395]
MKEGVMMSAEFVVYFGLFFYLVIFSFMVAVVILLYKIYKAIKEK